MTNEPWQDQTPPLTDGDLEEIRKEKVGFNVEKLGLSPDKAREWADRTVRVLRECMNL